MDEVNIVVVVPEANEMVCSGGRYYVEVTPLRLLPIIYAYCKMHTHTILLAAAYCFSLKGGLNGCYVRCYCLKITRTNSLPKVVTLDSQE